jgi:outer membrane receptor protein involved in Fe transport
VESYELGLKSELADRTVRVNAAVFDQQYTNFQLNTYTGLQFVVSSVRRVESKGAEINMDWATPLSGLSLSSGVVYAFTNITEFGESLPLFAPNQATTPEQSALLCAALVRHGGGDLYGAPLRLVAISCEYQREIQLLVQHRLGPRSAQSPRRLRIVECPARRGISGRQMDR